MLAKTLCNRQIFGVVRSNKLSVLRIAEEFPYNEHVSFTPKEPVVKNQQLENGVKVIARERQTGLVTAKFAIKGGSSAETDAEKGAAHFLATNAFAGNSETSAYRLVKRLEGLGVHFSAKADREKIVYTVSVLNNLVGPVLQDVLQSIATPPRYNHVFEECRYDTSVTYEKLQKCPKTQALDLLHEAAYGELTPYGSSAYADKLDNLSVDNILAFRAKHFVRENLVVSIDGLSADEAKKLLGTIPVPSGKASVSTKPTYVGGELKVRTRDESEAHVALAFATPAGQSSLVYDIINSNLVKRLAKKKVGLSSFHTKYTSGGLLGVYGSGAPADIEKLVKSAVDELKAIGSSAEANAHRNATSLALEGDANTLLNSSLNGLDLAASFDARSVTSQQVSDAAKALLKSKPSYVVYGRTGGTPSLATLSKTF